MSTTIAQMVLDIYANVATWFQNIMLATDGLSFWLGCFLVWQVTSKLISPAVGGAGRGSDTASRYQTQRRNFAKAKRQYDQEG